jgi:nucleoside-diphosphate-sugar epimerase
MKKILITGGNGYVGSNITKYALNLNWEVTNVSRRGR